ncbi:MAG: hypothetical protein VB100_10695 [Angelakisella sp.]|nr:hypothetical protein [Angelakisella sp.]
MEELLFYNYLNYQKEHKEHLGVILFQLPRPPLYFCAIAVFASFVAFFSLMKDELPVAVIAVLIEIFSNFLLDYTLENFKIKRCKERISNYQQNCQELKEWLLSNFVIHTKDIYEIKNRLEQHIITYKEEQKALTEQIYRWLQMFVVPVTILIITYTINQSFSMAEKTAYIISALIILGIIYGFIYSLRNILRFMRQRKVEQMQYFVEDLQGILDLDIFRINS